MSCCGKCQSLTVVYNGVAKQKSVFFTNISQVIQWIYKKFPELRCYALDLSSSSFALNTQADYINLARKSKSFEIQVEVAKNKYSKKNLGIFKLRLENGDLLSTGFLVSNTFAIIPQEFYEGKDISKLRLLFENGLELKLKEETEALRAGFNLVAVEIEKELECFQLVGFEVQNHIANAKGKVWYYTKNRPLLQAQTVCFERIFDEEEPLNLELSEGSIGAPILSHNNNLLGVVISSTTAIGFHHLVNLLKEKVIFQIADQYTEISDFPNFPITTCFLDTKNSELVYYSFDEAVHKVTSFVDFMKGSSAVVCSHGIFVTGLSPDQCPKSWIFTGSSVKELAPSLRRHLYHTSLFIDNCIYVISGTTAEVEIYDFKWNSWTLTTPLPKRRAMATAAYFNQKIFVIGGKRENTILRSILVFINPMWEKLEIYLPERIFSVGCIIVKNKFLLFGGENANGENSSSWELDVEKKNISNSNYSVLSTFGKFPVLYLESETMLYSNSCLLYKYDPISKEIYNVSLDEERVTSIN